MSRRLPPALPGRADGHEQEITVNGNMNRTISILSTATFVCMYSSILPLLNHGVAKAGVGFLHDVRDHIGQMFGWHNKVNAFSAVVSAYRRW